MLDLGSGPFTIAMVSVLVFTTLLATLALGQRFRL